MQRTVLELQLIVLHDWNWTEIQDPAGILVSPKKVRFDSSAKQRQCSITSDENTE